MRCLRRCRARRSGLNVFASAISTAFRLYRFDSSQNTVDVEAGASGASGRARVSFLIGLLMRPCKAKGYRARRITMELAYCSSSTLLFIHFHLHFRFSKDTVPLHIQRSGPGLGRLDFQLPECSPRSTKGVFHIRESFHCIPKEHHHLVTYLQILK